MTSVTTLTSRILQALADGVVFAPKIAEQIGAPAGSVSATLSKLADHGRVARAGMARLQGHRAAVCWRLIGAAPAQPSAPGFISTEDAAPEAHPAAETRIADLSAPRSSDAGPGGEQSPAINSNSNSNAKAKAIEGKAPECDDRKGTGLRVGAATGAHPSPGGGGKPPVSSADVSIRIARRVTDSPIGTAFVSSFRPDRPAEQRGCVNVTAALMGDPTPAQIARMRETPGVEPSRNYVGRGKFQ